MFEPKVIYEDSFLLVIDKPYSLVVNRAESVKGKTLQDWIDKNTQISKYSNKQILKYKDFIDRSGIVHRLDKDTSGVMAIAKNPAVFKNLQQQFKQREVFKKYLALVHGRVEPGAGNIKMPIARNPKDRKKFAVRLEGRGSVTYYQVESHYKKLSLSNSDRVLTSDNFKDNLEEYSLLELRPKTGRTHQLRVHLKHLGFPIVADPIYLGQKRLREDIKWCQRLFLHAKFLSFVHPNAGKRVEYRVNLPQDLRLVLEKLKS